MSFCHGPGIRPGATGERRTISPYYMEKSGGQNGTVFPLVKKFLWETAGEKAPHSPLFRKSPSIYLSNGKGCFDGIFGNFFLETAKFSLLHKFWQIFDWFGVNDLCIFPQQIGIGQFFLRQRQRHRPILRHGQEVDCQCQSTSCPCLDIVLLPPPLPSTMPSATDRPQPRCIPGFLTFPLYRIQPAWARSRRSGTAPRRT